jgi:hypothetical protein
LAATAKASKHDATIVFNMAYSAAMTRPLGHHELFTLNHADAESTLKPGIQPDKIA